MVEMVILQTTCTQDGKIKEIAIRQHNLDHHTPTMISKAFTIEGQPGQAIGFMTPTHVGIPIMSFTCLTLLLITFKPYRMPLKQFLKAIHYHLS